MAVPCWRRSQLHRLVFVMLQAEETERARIETEKETERKKATEDLERWKDEQRQKAEEVG